MTTTYTGTLGGMIMLGVGAGPLSPSGTASVMGSLPREHTGVGSATNGAFLQIGGALGVAVIGSLLATRYQDHVTAAVAPFRDQRDGRERAPPSGRGPALGVSASALTADRSGVSSASGPAAALRRSQAR